ncbi:MAG: indole-3-glycerol phosphate synthase TrpC [bacterium]
MASSDASILDKIVVTKKQEVAQASRRMPLEELVAQARETSQAFPIRDFRDAITQGGPIRLIAEVKKASPSAGLIRADFNPVDIARIYEDHGADCLSVLTDENYFQGHLTYLARVKAGTALPCLRKDFVISEYQVVEARLAGADAILLIAEILTDEELRDLTEKAHEWGMTVLVEFHDEANLPRVLASGADLVGVNNRDLHRMETRLDHTFRMRDRIPADVPLVSESGIKTHDDVVKLEKAGVSAILVGESLMRQADIGKAVDDLLGHGGAGRRAATTG